MTMNRSDIAKQLEPGLHGVLCLNYARVNDEHKALFDIETSGRSFEEEVSMAGMAAALNKKEGAAIGYDSMQETYTSRYTHETVALGFKITEEAIEDNLYEDYGKRAAKGLGVSMGETKEAKGAAVFNHAFDPAFAGGDGQALLSSAHPLVDGTTWNNTVAADASEAAIENACIEIADLRDERGLLISAQPVSLHIPVAQKFIMERILKSNLSTTVNQYGTDGVTSTNDTNALKNMGYFQRGVYINHRFTDTDAWFIRTNVTDGTKMFKRVGLGTDTREDFETGNIRFKARERYSFGWSDPRQWYGSQGQ